MVAGLRTRVRLDQGRLAEMLRGLDAANLGAAHADTVAGLLSCLGDLATVSFQPHLSGNPLRLPKLVACLPVRCTYLLLPLPGMAWSLPRFTA